MSTNFYVYSTDDDEKEIHVGKSSLGWTFSLHVIPELGLNSLEDWAKVFNTYVIRNEYGDYLLPHEMLMIINRIGYSDKLYGPLRRHKIDGEFCIGHGEGNYDYFLGEYS